MSLDTSKFTPEQVQTIKEQYLGNECGSDEYRETQPEKGMQMITSALTIMDGAESDNHSKRDELLTLTAKWLTAYVAEGGSWYAGDEQLEPCLAIVFDVMWAVGEHPYGSTTEELQEQLTW